MTRARRTTIAVIGDTHADARSRFDEHNRVMAWCAADFAARGADLVIHTGDIYEGVSVPSERAFVETWCQTVCEASPFVIVGGNHEREGDVAALGRLRTKHPITATESPLVVTAAGVAVACLPWPRKANLLAALGRPVDTASSDAIAVQLLRDVMRGLGLQLREHRGPRVLAAHVLVDGCYTDHDQPLCSMPLAVSVADLALAGASFNVLGHIHATGPRNQWSGPVPTAYTGSPRHCNYGEPGPNKGYLVLTFDGDRFVRFERVPTPCRPMLLIAGAYTAGAIRFAAPQPSEIRNADVRLRYRVAAADRAAAAIEERGIKAALLSMGAAEAKLEADVDTVAVARAPEVARAESTETQLLARWRMRGTHVDEGERARLLGKLSDLEDDVAA